MKYKIGKADSVRFMKYLVGGSIYFWAAYGVFAICYSGFGWKWFPAKVLSDFIGWTLNYLVQRLWAFSDHISLGEMQHAGRYIYPKEITFRFLVVERNKVHFSTNKLSQPNLIVSNMVEEGVDVSLKLFEGLSPLGTNDVLLHEVPEPFDEVEVW